MAFAYNCELPSATTPPSATWALIALRLRRTVLRLRPQRLKVWIGQQQLWWKRTKWRNKLRIEKNAENKNQVFHIENIRPKLSTNYFRKTEYNFKILWTIYYEHVPLFCVSYDKHNIYVFYLHLMYILFDIVLNKKNQMYTKLSYNIYIYTCLISYKSLPLYPLSPSQPKKKYPLP